MRRLVLLLTAFLAVAVGGSALAAQGTREKPRSGVAAKTKVHGGLLKAAADYLDLSPKQVHAEVRSGKSLAQLASAQGKSVDGLKAALVLAFKARVDSALADGRIDPAKAQKLLGRAPAIVERLVLRTHKTQAKRAHLRGGMLRVAGNYLGLTPKELVYELRSGTSLAQLATARGKSVAGLEAALFVAFKAKVDAAVAAGRLDAAHAQRLLQRAPARIEHLVNRARG